MDISVIIPSYNRRDELYRCILSIMNQSNCVFEIIVVDDGSNDATINMIRSNFPEVQLFQNQVNYGPGYSRNIGVLNAHGKYLLFLDSDTELPHENIFSNFMRFFNTHPDAGCVGGEIKQSKEYVSGRCIYMDGDSGPLEINNKPQCEQICDFLATCCCMVKKDIAFKVGGFDPYYGFGGEDKDFGYRVNKLGYNNYVSAECAVYHHHSPKGRSVDETFKYHKTRMRFVLKCFSPISVFVAFLIWVSSFFVFYGVLPFKLFFFVIKRKPVKKENVVGGYLLARAFFENLFSYKKIKEGRRINFLKNHEIDNYIHFRSIMGSK